MGSPPTEPPSNEKPERQYYYCWLCKDYVAYADDQEAIEGHMLEEHGNYDEETPDQ